MGTAGSLYAISNFTKINPQLDDKTNNLTPEQEAKNFINECHKRNIRVIIDLPSCGSYDLFLSRPELFVTDSSNKPVVPADWTDVRLFKSVNNDGSLNDALYTEYKNFVDFVQKLGADGIRADVGRAKPVEFWNVIIPYSRALDSNFGWLAETYTHEDASPQLNMPYDRPQELLEVGFDSYYGQYHIFKDWTTNDQLYDYVKENIDMNNEIGSRYGVSRERIRQIETRAIAKLKKMCRNKNLSVSLENYIGME